ncbi:FUSC family protein [Desulfocurvus sp. DL9XJH121]
MPYSDSGSTYAHLRHGFKTALATLIAYGLAKVLGLQYGYWAALSSVIVMQISVADSLQMCWYRLSGTLVGAVIGIVTILIFPEHWPWTEVGLFLSIGFCAYMTRYNTRYRMAAITCCIVVLASVGEEGRVLFGMERVVEIFLGVSSAFLVSVLLWPLRASRSLNERLRGQFATCAKLYQAIVAAYLDGGDELPEDFLDAFALTTGENRGYLRKVQRHERFLYHEDTRTLGLKVETLRLSARNMSSMMHSLSDAAPQSSSRILEPELRTLCTLTADALRAAGEGTFTDAAPLLGALESLEARIAEMRQREVTRVLATRDMMQFFSFLHLMRFMALDVLRLVTPQALAKAES